MQRHSFRAVYGSLKSGAATVRHWAANCSGFEQSITKEYIFPHYLRISFNIIIFRNILGTGIRKSRTKLTFSRILHVCVARASLRDFATGLMRSFHKALDPSTALGIAGRLLIF